MNWKSLVELGCELPQVSEGQWYRTPALMVHGKGFVRLKEDGQSVVFERPTPGLRRNGTILLWRLGQSEPRILTRGNQPRFSRDGKWIVFQRRKGDQADIWRMHSDGTAKRQLTRSRYDEEFPSLSPLGDYLVYASVRAAKEESQIYLMNVSSGRETQLTQIGQNSRPLW